MADTSQYTDSESEINNLDLKVSNLPLAHWGIAPKVARQFLEEYPDRIGFQQAVVYLAEQSLGGTPNSIFVYRTKTSVVVRGNGR